MFFEKSINQKRKIHEKVVPHFIELIGFIYIKTTCSKKLKTWCKQFVCLLLFKMILFQWIKLVADFLELIGFIYIKTIVSISRLTSFLRFGKWCFLARDISNSLSFFILHFCEYLRLRSIVFQIVKNSLTVRLRRSFCIPYTLWTQKSRWRHF